MYTPPKYRTNAQWMKGTLAKTQMKTEEEGDKGREDYKLPEAVWALISVE